MEITSQILGLFGFLFFILSIQMKSKKMILLMQLISCVFYSVAYGFLGALSAVLIDIISIFRCSLFGYYDIKNKKSPIIIPIILVILSLLVGIYSYHNFYDIIPVVISIIYIISTWQDNSLIIRLGFITGAILWIIYNLSVGAYTPMIGNFFEITSGIIAMIRLRKRKR